MRPWSAGAGFYLFAMAMTTGLLVGCTQDDMPSDARPGPGNSAATGDDDIPNLYLDRSLEFVVAGVPARGGYFKQVERCESAGMPTTPLSDADAGKIATGRRQYWRTAGEVAYREEVWSWDTDSLCDFRLRRTGTHAFFDAGGATYLNLETGEVTSDPGSGARYLSAAPVEPDTMSDVHGWTGPTMREVAGQPCEQWESKHGYSVCAWAGGTQWGYTRTVTSVYGDATADSGSLVLEAEPPPGKTGVRLSTESFVVGGKLDRNAMRLPEVATVEK